MLDPYEEHEEEEGEGWLVSYADMVTLLFGLFVILYSLSFMEERKFAEFGKSIAAGFQSSNTDISTDAKPEATKIQSDEQQQMRAFQMLVAVLNLGDPNSAVRKVAKAYEEYINAKGTNNMVSELLKNVDTVTVKEQINLAGKGNSAILSEIVIPSQYLFSPKSAQLLSTAPSILDSIFKVLFKAANSIQIQIEGHVAKTDFPATDLLASYTLSSNQANAIGIYFINKGLPMESISSVGRGNSQSLISNNINLADSKSDNKFTDRRINIIIRKK